MSAAGQSPAELIDRNQRDAARPAPYQPLVVVLFAVAAGIVLDRYGRPDIPGVNVAIISWLIAICSLALWSFAWHRKRERLSAALLIMSAAFTAAAWHDLNWYLFARDDLAQYASIDSAPACIEVVARESIERAPAPRETPLRAIPGVERSRLLVEAVAIRDGKAWRPASGLCQLMVNGHVLGVQADDRLRAFGQLARPAPPLNPGEFDFAAHARSDRELTRLQSSAPDCVRVLGAFPRRTSYHLLEAVRSHCERLIRRYVGPQHAGIAAALLLGSRDGLPREETDPYFLTGTIHVLVVSGLNVAILTSGLLLLMRSGWLSRRAGLVVIGGVAVAYAIVAHGQPPVVRAAVVAVLMCLAAWSGRPAAAFNALAAAALFAIALNPTDLYRIGPQLSFLAVATLIWIGQWGLFGRAQPTDRLDQLLAAARPWPVRVISWMRRWFVAAIAVALVVWLVSAPLVLYRFNLVTPIAVLISPLVSVCVLVALYAGFMMLAVGDLAPWFADLMGSVCQYSLVALEATVEGGQSLPAGHFWSPGPAWWWIVGFYFGLIVVMLRGRRFLAPRWQVALLSAWILLGLIQPLSRATTRESFECSFVAVGHGTCVVLQSPTGETLLYDAGSLGSPEYATQSIAAYLWNRGILRIDGIVLSHADVDHYNAVPGLLERFNIGTIYVSPLMFDSFGESVGSGGPETLLAAIERAGVPLREVWAGDRLRLGGDVELDIIHPPRRGVLGSDNANSITLAIEYEGKRILLPGDLETPGIEDVMAERPYDCDVLLAPHHGSRRSDPPGFAAWSTPEWVVVSSGGRDDLRPVVHTYSAAGAQVLLTHEHGAIELEIRPTDRPRARSHRREIAGVARTTTEKE